MNRDETIQLIDPPDGSHTEPLQQHPFPTGPSDATESASNFTWNALQVVSPDRSLPRPVRLSWHRLGWSWRATSYEVILGRTPSLTTDIQVFRDITHAWVDIWHLYIGTTYYWKVIAKRAGHIVAASDTRSFTTDTKPPRWIRVPGITNARDIGGWPIGDDRVIHQGKVYRSSEMNGRLQLAERGRRVLIDELGIKTDLDLRSESEQAAPALPSERVTWIHAPISPYDCISDAAFRDDYLKIFRVFADPSHYPILFHCVGGADRGGTVAFLLNGLLGKAYEHLMVDYELTTLSVWGERSRFSDQFTALLNTLSTFADDPHDLHTQVENYLLSIGMMHEELATIRHELIGQRSEYTALAE